MTKANECTCPSGDGSLRHPCPAHIGPFDKLVGSPVHNESEPDLPPLDEHLAQVFETGMALSESVEQAGGDERDLQAEGAQGELLPCPFCGGQAHLTYDDYVHDDLRPMPVVECNACHTWVRAESWNKRAALAQPSPVRSSLLINGYQLRAALDFIAPDGTAEQLKSEACIEWRQQDADFLEAGLYAFCAEYPEEGGVLLDEEPTTAQPSPLQSDQAEAERPALWAVHAQGPDELYAAFSREDAEKHAAELNALPMPEGIAVGAVVVPSPWPAVQHWQYLAEQEQDHKNEIAGRLRQLERICEGLPQDAIDGGWTVQGIRGYAKRLEDQLKAALARVAELEGKLTDWVHEGFRLNEALAVAKAQHSVPDDDMILQIFADNAEHSEQGDEHGYCIVREQHAQAIARKLLAAAPGNSAQHSVPEGWKLVPLEAPVEMLRAGSIALGMEPLSDGSDGGYPITGQQSTIRQCYAAMLAAAPGKEVGHE